MFLLACTQSPAEAPSDANKAVVRQWLQEEDQMSLATIDPVVDKWTTSDFQLHGPGAPAPVDQAGNREVVRSFLTGFSGISHDIRQLVAEGDLVSILATLRMKHTGSYEGLAATNRAVAVDAIIIVRIRDAKIAEEWFVFDSAGLMAQLSALRTTDEAVPH